MPRPTRGQSSYTIVHAARDLRRGMTPAEERLWNALRGRRLNGLKFRRQHPLDRFVLDFYCVERRLAVEVDGVGHTTPDQAARDEERTMWLNAQGVRVLRVTNDEVEHDFNGVVRRIAEETSSPLPPSPESKDDSGEGGV
jgi:very-short-patch-repair endonuclease